MLAITLEKNHQSAYPYGCVLLCSTHMGMIIAENKECRPISKNGALSRVVC